MTIKKQVNHSSEGSPKFLSFRLSACRVRFALSRPSASRVLAAAAPAGVRESAAALVETERVLASVLEAVIGACYLHAGYERTADAVVQAFMPEIEEALEHPVEIGRASCREECRSR